MIGLLFKIGAAAVVGAIAFLVVVFVGGLLATTGVQPAEFIGRFLERWAIAIAVVVALWFFFFGGFTWRSTP